MPPPNITLAALPHVGTQPLAFLYLSQIPQTGLELGLLGTVLYWLALIAWAVALAYLALFGAVPLANRSIRGFGSRIRDALNTGEMAPVSPVEPAAPPPPIIQRQEASPAPRGYSSYEGFKSFAHNGALSIEDIVKGLARNVPPVYEKVEPIDIVVEPIPRAAATEAPPVSAPTHIRGFAQHTESVKGFISALVEGDRPAVFAGLREHVRGSGSPERLVSEVVCLLDDAYRARIDGTDCDADVVRMTARLDTPTLEKLVASLTTAIDSSYSQGVTGAKLALARSLAVLGA